MTLDAEMYPLPFTVRVKAGPPATAEVGLMEEMVGVAATSGKLTALDAPGVETLMAATPSVSDQGGRYAGGQLGGADECGSERGTNP